MSRRDYVYQSIERNDTRSRYHRMTIHRRCSLREDGRLCSVFGPGSVALRRTREDHDRICVSRARQLGYVKPPTVVPVSAVVHVQVITDSVKRIVPYPGVSTWTGP